MKIYILLALSLILVNCQRAKNEETSQVTISLPADISSASKMTTSSTTNLLSSGCSGTECVDLISPVNEILSGNLGVIQTEPSDSLVVDADTWLKIVPAGYSQAPAINCYMVVATQVDSPALNVNKCTRSGESDLAFELFDGPIANAAVGADPSKLTITLPVDKTYIFTLLGFHAPDKDADCKKIATADGLRKAKVTQPYMVGASTAVKIVPQSTGKQTVEFAMNTFDPSKFYEDCQITSGTIRGRNIEDIKPAWVRITKDEFPEGAFPQQSGASPASVCYPLTFSLLNTNNQPVSALSDTAVTLYSEQGKANYCANNECPAFSAGLTPTNTYETYGSCRDDLSATTTFNILKGMVHGVRWVRSTSAVGTFDYYRALIAGQTLLPESVGVRAKDGTSGYTFDVVGPKKVLAGQCVQYDVAVRSYAGVIKNMSIAKNLFISTKDGVGGSFVAGKTFRSRSACESSTGTAISANGSSEYKFSNTAVAIPDDPDANNTAIGNGLVDQFYVKFDGETNVRRSIEVKMASGASVAPDPAVLTVNPQLGSDVSKRLRIIGNRRHIAPSICYGPFEVIVENDEGTSVVNTTPMELEFSAPAGVSLYRYSASSTACQTLLDTSGTKATFSANKSSVKFFIRVTRSGNSGPQTGEFVKISVKNKTSNVEIKEDSFFLRMFL